MVGGLLITESDRAGRRIQGAEASAMRDLRIYINSISADAQEIGVTFYSQRADGPVYRWLYEEKAGRWCFSRVRLSRFELRVLCIANWCAVPTSLRTRLDEHYLE